MKGHARCLASMPALRYSANVLHRPVESAMGSQDAMVDMLMDSAYEGDDTCAATLARNFVPVLPAHPQRKHPWSLDKRRYRQRIEVERLFRRIKAYRRVFTRYVKLDVMFAAFVFIALICEHLR